MEFFGRFKAASCNGSDSVVADQDHFRLPDAAGPTSAAKAARSTPARPRATRDRTRIGGLQDFLNGWSS